MTRDPIIDDLRAIRDDIARDGPRSETFYPAYSSGEEAEDDLWTLDFGEWASVYRTWLARQADYRNEIQRLPRNGTSLAGLIQTVG